MPPPDCDNQRGQDELAAALDCLSKRFEAHDLVVWNAVSVAFASMQGSARPKDDRGPGDRLFRLYSVIRGYLVVKKTVYACSDSKGLFAGASHIRAVMWWLVNGAYRIVHTAIRGRRHQLITVFVHGCLLPRSRMRYPGYFKTRLICGSFSPAFAPPGMMPLFASVTRRHASACATVSGPVSLQRPAEMPPPSICRPITAIAC